MSPRFSSTPGGVELRLAPEEIEVLSLLSELLASVGSVAGDPAAARLAITTYPDDEQAQAEYKRFMAPELERGRTTDRSSVVASLEAASGRPVELSMVEAEAWLLVLNESRLTLAARIGIEEEGWGEHDEEGGDLDPPMAFLHFLTYLHGELTAVLMEKL